MFHESCMIHHKIRITNHNSHSRPRWKLMHIFNTFIMREILPPGLFEIFDRAGICSSKQIILLSLWDIKKLTKLQDDDIRLVKSIVANSIYPLTNNGQKIDESLKISTGCTDIDILLKGGFRRGTISELYGESGSGKTQIAIQTTVHCSPSGCVYICTEDLFPVKRFDHINKLVNGYNSDSGDQIFVEHLTEPHELLTCLRVRLPKLLTCKNISLIILDSIAAPFRCESTCYVQRAEELKEVAILLLKIAQNFKLSVVCINQVTASFNNRDNVLPSLGLVWSNMVSYRFLIKKTGTSYKMENANHESYIRQLQIINAPDLPNNIVEFIITNNGVETIKSY